MALRRYVVPLAVALAATLLVGCASDDDPGLMPGKEDTVSPSPTDPTGSPSEPTAAPSDPVSLAVADLAAREGVDTAEVEVVSREEVTWRDGSLGCAKKGDFYTQALVDGGRITLRVGRTTYEYHYGGSRAPFWCESPTQ